MREFMLPLLNEPESLGISVNYDGLGILMIWIAYV